MSERNLTDCIAELADMGPDADPGTLIDTVVADASVTIEPLAAVIRSSEVAPLHVLRALIRILPNTDAPGPVVEALVGGASKHGYCLHKGGKEALEALRDASLPASAVLPELVEALEAADREACHAGPVPLPHGIAVWGSVVGEIFGNHAGESASYAERIGALYATGAHHTMRQASYYVLKAIGKHAATAERFVLHVLRSGENFEKTGAAQIAGNIGSAPLILQLREMALTADYHLLLAVLEALAKNNTWEETFTRRLLSLRLEAGGRTKAESSPEQVKKADEVAMLAGPVMFDSLLTVLGDSKDEERALAAKWMKGIAKARRKEKLVSGWVHDNEHLLARLLADPQQQVARCIAGALGACLSFASMERWRQNNAVRSKVLSSPVEMGSWILAQIFQRVEEQAAGLALFTWMLAKQELSLRRMAILAYGWVDSGKLPQTALEQLASALNDEDALNCTYAALACLRHKKSFAPAFTRLGELLLKHPDDPEIAAAIGRTLKVAELC